MLQKKYCYDYPRPALTTDAAVLSYNGENISILLIKRGKEPFLNQWALPGGFVNMDESTEEAVKRELLEETNLNDIPLIQFKTFSEPNRDPRHRTISVVYTALIEEIQGQEHKAGDDAAESKWFDISNLPQLAFDHDLIVKEVLIFLIERIEHTPNIFIGFTKNELYRIKKAIK